MLTILKIKVFLNGQWTHAFQKKKKKTKIQIFLRCLRHFDDYTNRLRYRRVKLIEINVIIR